MKERSNNVLFFSGNTAWGMYNFRGNLMRHFVERGCAVSVFAPEDPVFSDKLRELGCNVIDIKVESKGRNPLSDLMLIWHYYKIFKREKPSVSITYTIKPNIYASIAAWMASIPFLPVTTGMGYVFLHDGIVCKIAKRLYKFAFAHANKVWFLNRDDMQTFKEQKLIRDEQIELLHGEGIDTVHFSIASLPSLTNTCTFILVGRILIDKGIAEYVEAAKTIKKVFPESRFLLLGALWEDNPAAISKNQLDEWCREGDIEYLGTTDDVRVPLSQADCVVLPSYREGIPFTLMEGASMGRPLIATDIPGCRDVIIDGKTGFLCKVKNPQSLADAMIKMIKLSPEQRTDMGKAGRAYMEQEFDIKHIIYQYEETINKMCGENY